MHYEGNIIRPPSEANSILLQVTVGCSRNKCTFCGTYAGERFKIKNNDIIMEDIAFAAAYCKRQRRVFLCDGDALIIPQKRLLNILTEIEKQLPWVTRVGIYANAKSLKMKSMEELITLREHGLGIAYMGLETGDDVTLKNIEGEELVQISGQTNSKGYWDGDFFVTQNLVSGGVYFVKVSVSYLESNNFQEFETIIVSDTGNSKSSG